VTEVVLATTYGVLLHRPGTGVRFGLLACWPVVLAAALALGAAFASQLPSFPATLLALAIYTGVAYALGAFPREALDAFRRPAAS
jgi:hypothetical protein